MIFAELIFALCLITSLVSFHVYGSLELLLGIWSAFWVMTFLIPKFQTFRWPASILLTAYLILSVTLHIPFLNSWPLDLLTVTLFCTVILRKLSDVDLSAKWTPNFSKSEWLSVFAIVGVSVLCLFPYFAFHPEIARKWPLPDFPPAVIPLIVVLAAIINGLREEIVYRWIIQRTFLRHMRSGLALGSQALAFGFLHFHNGFPQGWPGVGLTTAFGLLMGVQFRWSKSMSLAWLTHSVVDAVMFGIILIYRS